MKPTWSLIQLCFVLHLFTISWSGVLRFGDWFPLPFVFLILTLGACCYTGVSDVFSERVKNILIHHYDIFLVGAILLMTFLVLVVPTSKSGNYLMAYYAVFASFIGFSIFGTVRVDLDTILRFSFYGVNFICVFLVVEVIGKSFLGFDVFEFIPRTKDATASIAGLIFRGYGLSTEPTQVANYFVCFMPMALLYKSRTGGVTSLFYPVFIFVCAALSFSAGFFLTLLAGMCFYILISRQRLFSSIRSFWLVLLLVTLVVFSIRLGGGESADIIDTVFEYLISKITLSGGTSVGVRMLAVEMAFQELVESPFLGLGLGAWSARGQDSPMNWYLMIATESGIFVLFLFLLWLGSQLLDAVLTYRKTGNATFLACSVSIFCGIAYFVFLSTFQNMFLLTSLLIFRIAKYDYKNRKRSL
ncbi:hypothetical protein OAI36_00035 [Alphaproteobacteria bacterium]|nr:hypothetical protein [Alphaproteobacteria bacterium]